MLRSLLNATLVPLSAAVAAQNCPAPTEEIDVLVTATTTAVLLARRGNAADGYVCLCAARRRAELLHREDQPWTGELLDRYTQALERYANHYRIARE